MDCRARRTVISSVSEDKRATVRLQKKRSDAEKKKARMEREKALKGTFFETPPWRTLPRKEKTSLEVYISIKHRKSFQNILPIEDYEKV